MLASASRFAPCASVLLNLFASAADSSSSGPAARRRRQRVEWTYDLPSQHEHPGVYSHDNGCGRLLDTGLPLGRFGTASGANSTLSSTNSWSSSRPCWASAAVGGKDKVFSSCAGLTAASAEASLLPAAAAAAALPAGGAAVAGLPAGAPPSPGAGLTAAGMPWPRICLLASILARVSHGTYA